MLSDQLVRRTWYFLLAGSACFAVPFWFLITGPNGWIGFWRVLGVRSTHPSTAAGWMLGALVAILFIAATMRSYPFIRDHVLDHSLPLLKLSAMLFGFLAAVVEEVWFRRVPMDWAASHGRGGLLQVVLSAVLFALPHSVWGLAARSARVLVGSLVATTLLGASLGVVYLAAGRALAPCIWSHGTINIVLEPWLLLAALQRGQNDAPELVSIAAPRAT